MLPTETYKPSGGRVVFGCVLAVLLGMATPLLTLIEVTSLMPIIMFSGVFMVFLYGWAGRLPAWLYMTVQLASAAVLSGSDFMWMTMAAGVFPAIISMRGMMRKQPFFEQLRLSIIYYLVGTIAAVLILRLSVGGNPISGVIHIVGEEMESLPDVYYKSVVDAINASIPSDALPGGTAMTVSTLREQLSAMQQQAIELYGASLPGTLLSGAATSGVLTALWGNWLMARHGLATVDVGAMPSSPGCVMPSSPESSYVGMTRWFLPADLTRGLLLIWLFGFIQAQTTYSAAEAVFQATSALVGVAFGVQGLCAIDRFFYRRGASSGRRHTMMALALLLGPLLSAVLWVFALIGAALRVSNPILFLIGAGSALFGSHGALRRRPEPPKKVDND